MKWDEFIRLVGILPVIDTKILFAGISYTEAVKVQISRWQKASKLIQVKRGIYVLAEPYRKIDVYEPYIASLLKKPSYISLEKALEYHDLIPEAVTVYTSVTTKRPGRFVSKIGTFEYKHVKNSFFWGYDSVSVNKQTAFIASPEKALLDFFYLKGVRVSFEYLDEMRLQNMEKINTGKLLKLARRFSKPGIARAAEIIVKYINARKSEEKAL